MPRALPLVLLLAVVGPLTTVMAQPVLDHLQGILVSPDPESMALAWQDAVRWQRAGFPRRAIPAFADAYRFGKPASEVYHRIGRCLMEDEDVPGARLHLQAAMAAGGESAALHHDMGTVESLSGDVGREIESYTRAVTLDPNFGPSHFMLALAYDKVDNSPKVLEHAQKAIRIDPAYKERLKPRIKDSNVSRRISRIVARVLEDAKYERLEDARIEEYAQEMQAILGEAPPDPDPAPTPPVPPGRPVSAFAPRKPPPPPAPPPEPSEPPMRGFLR